MLVLALDTATAATTVRVVAVDGGRPVTRAGRRHVDPRGHGEWLAPLIDAALAGAGIRPGRLTAIVAGTGPGPFTGLRVGLATAAAMAQALGLPTYGVCSLDGIGAAAVVDVPPAVPALDRPERPRPPEPPDPGSGTPVAGEVPPPPARAVAAGAGTAPVLVATDARRREVYWAVYRAGARLAGPAVDRPADLSDVLREHGVRQGYGEGALRYRHLLGLPVAPEPLHPDPAALVAVALDRVVSGAPAEPLTPLYLRRPDAAEPARRATGR